MSGKNAVTCGWICSSVSKAFKSEFGMRLLLLAVVPLALSMTALAAENESQDVVLAHVRLIDGTGAPPRENIFIAIRDGKIVGITKDGTDVPKSARLIDYAGKTVMPGIINAHGHLALVCGTQNSATCYTKDNVIAELRQYERFGVTTMLSLGLNRDLIYEVQAEQRAGKLDGARVYSADRGIGVPDGAPPLAHAPDQLYQPKTPEEARANVDAMASRHANFVKVWVDNMHGSKPSMDPAVYRAVIDEAHRDKIPVAAHIYYLADAKSLVHDGVNVLAHSVRDQPVDERTDRAMKQRGTYYIPTLTVDWSFFGFAEKPNGRLIAFFKRRPARRYWRR